MNTWTTAKKALMQGCVIFTIITLAFFSLGALLTATGVTTNDDINIKFLWIFFILSEALAFANMILSAKSIAIPLRMLIHFLVCGALYFVTVVVFGGFIKNGASTLIAMALFVLIYLICAIAIAVRLSQKEKIKSEKKGYTSQFR